MSRAPQLVSARAAARLTRVPWLTLRAELERSGYRVYRVAGRDRVAESDLVALLQQSRQRTVAESANRIGLAIELATAEMGLAKRRRRRKVGAVESATVVAAVTDQENGQDQLDHCERGNDG